MTGPRLAPFVALILLLNSHSTFSANVNEKFFVFRDNGVSVLRGNSGLGAFIEGKITQKKTKSFERALKYYPAIRRMGLYSPDGDIDAAFDIADILHDHHLETLISATAKCYSACAFIFLAGETRWAIGELDVHQIKYLRHSKVRVAKAQKKLSRIVGALSSYGVSPEILKLMFETPHDEMHVLSLDELREYNVMHAYQMRRVREVRRREANHFVLPRSKPGLSVTMPIPKTAPGTEASPGSENDDVPRQVVELRLSVTKLQQKRETTASPGKRDDAAPVKTSHDSPHLAAYSADWTLARGYREAFGVKSRCKNLSARVIIWPGSGSKIATFASIDILFNDSFAADLVTEVGKPILGSGNNEIGTLGGPIVRIKPGAFRHVLGTGNLLHQRNCELIRDGHWLEIPFQMRNGESDTLRIGRFYRARRALSPACGSPS
ncbi:hypothetical protein [Breoghania sp.]|uniref:COG3904 family protein n=1 Tax=Breoghania sp. TaxID=2065378 RepID=UPI002630EE55|nr:hypothetical protein [Breoghania sp.]MDJ0930189.1 hypothetical protein [Breoghania sp.]